MTVIAASLPVVATSAGVVALAEIGDKTMLLAVLLAARYRQPAAVLAGILVATLANHGLAAWAGAALAGLLAGPLFQLAVAIGFLAMAVWTLVPDAMEEAPRLVNRAQAFTATGIAFFVVEIGDKTQVATVALGARFHDILAVTIGTTAGMMLANGPAVLVGERALALVPLAHVRRLAALLFAGLGLWLLWSLWPVIAGTG
jgi:putative Ca2+/H+ antiporter (TMEM165/GDT1 family)